MRCRLAVFVLEAYWSPGLSLARVAARRYRTCRCMSETLVAWSWNRSLRTKTSSLHSFSQRVSITSTVGTRHWWTGVETLSQLTHRTGHSGTHGFGRFRVWHCYGDRCTTRPRQCEPVIVITEHGVASPPAYLRCRACNGLRLPPVLLPTLPDQAREPTEWSSRSLAAHPLSLRHVPWTSLQSATHHLSIHSSTYRGPVTTSSRRSCSKQHSFTIVRHTPCKLEVPP